MCFDKESLDQIFTSLPEDKHVAILVQQSPDPDCLGAAAGFATLLEKVYGLESKIYHKGEVSHPQNKSIKNVLHIALQDGNELNLEDVSATVVLDTDLTSTGFKSDSLQSVDVRIDHHSMDREEVPLLNDVRAVGSTCAIVWEYLNKFEVDLKDYPNVATAMILGIKTDTLDFTSSNTSLLDMEAYRALLPNVDKVALARVTNFPLPEEVFELEGAAYNRKVKKGTILTSFIGEITAHSRDIISTIADRFSRMAGTNTVVIIAIIDNHLQASIRSDDARVDVGDICSKVFGKEHSGAKEGAGGARLPLNALEYINDKDIRSKVLNEIVLTFQNKIFSVLGEEVNT